MRACATLLTNQSNQMVKHPGTKKALAPASDGDAEARILDAAHLVFVRHGTAGARMQEIADEAGVNKALLHYYFRSKERLAAAVFERVARGLFARLGMVAMANVDLETKVRRMIATYLDELSQTPYAPGYLICEMTQNPDRATQLLRMTGAPRGDGTPEVAFLGAPPPQIQERAPGGKRRATAPRQFV